jgi:hypothetical protein
MPERNRVTPYGEIIVAATERGRFMGNRGSLHKGHEIVRAWNGKRWITCVLEYRGWKAPTWEDEGRYTALFFHDEAVAFAAGHRPCALCRRADYERYRDAWEAALGERLGADDMDTRLHRDRLDGRRKRLHPMQWHDLPDGAFVDLDGTPALVTGSHVRPWAPGDGYGPPIVRPASGVATVITPAANVAVLLAGYPQTEKEGAGTRSALRHL